MSEQPDDIELMDYADGLLDEAQTAAVESHMSVNPEARRKIEGFRRSSEILEHAHGDTEHNAVPQSATDLIKNAKQPSAKIFKFPRNLEIWERPGN